MRLSKVFVGLAVLLLVTPAAVTTAETFHSGSTGADGAFAPSASVQLTIPPDGVFNFTTINVPAGVTVSFATRAGVRQPPITWLATGNVVVAGRIDVSGGIGGAGGAGTQLFSNGGVAGPGGFDGGAGSNGIDGVTGAAGLGPGGGLPGSATAFPGHAGHLVAAPGASGGRAYGDARLVPLIGGSGGGGGSPVSSDTRCCHARPGFSGAGGRRSGGRGGAAVPGGGRLAGSVGLIRPSEFGGCCTSADSPTAENAMLNPAVSATIRKSQAKANAAPAPAATPLTAATTGLGIVARAVAIGV